MPSVKIPSPHNTNSSNKHGVQFMRVQVRFVTEFTERGGSTIFNLIVKCYVLVLQLCFVIPILLDCD